MSAPSAPAQPFADASPTDAARGPISVEDAAAAALLREPVVEHFRSDGKELAAFPALAMELFGYADRRDWEVASLVQVIGRDPVIAASVIKSANSAWYAGVREIETLQDAVVRMGTREAASVAVAAAMRALFDPESRAIQNVFPAISRRLWTHSLRTAAAAKWLARECGKGDPDRAFLGGLLHDIGKTFALRSFAALLVSGRITGPVPDGVAMELLEGAHAELGVEVAVFWSFPEFLTSICMLHHEAAPPAEEHEVHLIRVASGVEELLSNPWHRESVAEEVQASAAALGLGLDTLTSLGSKLQELGERVGL